MTKKDGDKIRAFQTELEAMQRDYAVGSSTWEAARELEVACELALRGSYFEVHSPRPSRAAYISPPCTPHSVAGGTT